MIFCTLFDSNYIVKGLALYESLMRVAPESQLYIFAMDGKCKRSLDSFNLKNVVVDSIEEIKDERLEAARVNRSRAEFCWTCGAYSTDYFLSKYNLPYITYIDSDLMFLSSPKQIFDNLEEIGASVALTPHFMNHTLFGKYCVQFVWFKNDEKGVAALSWWKDACLDWCYCKLEDGKYADQKYLETIYSEFQGVYELTDRGLGIAYWNIRDCRFEGNDIISGKERWPMIFFHFSGINLRVKDDRIAMMLSEYFPPMVIKRFVEPYAALLQMVYGKYFSKKISGFFLCPINRFRYALKKISFKLRKFPFVDYLVFIMMKARYKERKTPYNEK